MPDGMGLTEAGSIPLAGPTSLQALTDVAGVTPGQKVFVQAGAGGAGSLAQALDLRAASSSMHG
ncbi:hypothetical protein [Sorangium sp. So ce1000]|uniref:hypothetical protein n=1 Tax=Sorangium sp. So ce1000 TaxID=3133325 RepID=UPI003F5F0600